MQAIEWMQKHGQAVWLDHAYELELSADDLRGLIADGLIEGLTSSTGLRQGRFTQGLLNQADLRLLSHAGEGGEEILVDLRVRQFREACDVFMPIFESSNAQGGVVTLDLDPRTFGDSALTKQTALNLWERINRPNLMLSIPVAKETMPVISDLLEQGVNINVSMIYSVGQYIDVLEAYLGALERRLERKAGIDHILSAASFFVGDIDRVVNQRLESFEGEGTEAQRAGALFDQVGMAIARLAYAQQSVSFNDGRFSRLREQGAKVQQLLWIGVDRKETRARDRYLRLLLGAETVTAVRIHTLTSKLREDREPAQSLEDGLSEARGKLAALESLGISIDEFVGELQAQLLAERRQDYEQVLADVGSRRDRHEQELGVLQEHYRALLDEATEEDFISRIWQGDASVWSDDRRAAKKVSNSLGWLDLPVRMEAILEQSRQFAAELAQDQRRTLVYLTSGSLGKMLESLGETSDQVDRELVVADLSNVDALPTLIETTDLQGAHFILAPSTSDHRVAIEQIEKLQSTMAKTNFSRFGEQTTLIAYPEIGARLDKIGLERRHMFPVPPDIPFHYGGWTFPGLIAAAWLDLDLDEIQDGMEEIFSRCLPSIAPERNPALALAVSIASGLRAERSPILLMAQRPERPMAEWVHTLLEETGLMAAMDNSLKIASPGDDLEPNASSALVLLFDDQGSTGTHLESLIAQNFPVKVIETGSSAAARAALSGLWLFATAVLGSLLQVNPFGE